VKSFRMNVSYQGESGKPYYSLLLSVPELNLKKSFPFSLQEKVSEDQALKVIDYLIKVGSLDRAHESNTKKMSQPSYSLSVRAGDLRLTENLGWGLDMLKWLDGLRKALEGDAAKAMDTLLGRLYGHRREWMAVVTEKKPAAEESITVNVVGTLRTSIFVIGGETTGTTITAKGITWELDFGRNAAFRTAAEKLNGTKVIVQGSLERRRGVEIKERWIVTVTGLPVSVDGESGFHATVGRNDTRIRFVSEGDKTVFDINSKFGIDTTTISRMSDEWPKSILVRLHLGGLESFKVGSGNVAVEWSVSSTGDHATRISQVSGKRVAVLDLKSPYYTKVRIVGGNGKIPLKDGYFEVPLPAKLFEGNPEEITLRWIDFYRN
jgi:hypothetical protein